MTKTIKPQHAKTLTAGAWTARWATWVVELRYRATGWRATVWTWPQGSRGTRLDEAMGFANPLDAAQWACRVLLQQGAKAMVDGQPRALIDFLAFSPAPALEVQVTE